MLLPFNVIPRIFHSALLKNQEVKFNCFVVKIGFVVWLPLCVSAKIRLTFVATRSSVRRSMFVCYITFSVHNRVSTDFIILQTKNSFLVCFTISTHHYFMPKRLLLSNNFIALLQPHVTICSDESESLYTWNTTKFLPYSLIAD